MIFKLRWLVKLNSVKNIEISHKEPTFLFQQKKIRKCRQMFQHAAASDNFSKSCNVVFPNLTSKQHFMIWLTTYPDSNN